MPPAKSGIALIGSCIVDELIPVIEPGQLSYTDANRFVSEQELKGERISYSTGGMALNVGIDLARIAGGYPLGIFGKVGQDRRAELIRKQMQEHGLSADTLVIDAENDTSSTEVLHIRMPNGFIERIFRHTMGAMGSFAPADLNLSMLAKYKIALFGYGLLMPQFDLEESDYGTVLGKCLADLHTMGVQTAIDFVSPTMENRWKLLRYKKAIAHVDICCINEDQASVLTGKAVPAEACKSLVVELGAALAVVHCGAAGPNFAFSRTFGLHSQRNFKVAEEEYKGNVGAGDAFTAGILHGQQKGWAIEESMRFAAAAAAMSLADVSATGAMKTEAEIVEYSKNRPLV
jgi:sugar/nucleoside kinase (ribokinase family)